MTDLKIHIKIALGYFFFIAVLGCLLRLDFITDVLSNYRNIVHTHSHIALLGWVYTALTTLIYKSFIDRKKLDKKYRMLFWFSQITLIGMLITFPLEGYGLFSIIFSTLFLFASYWFFWFIKKNTSAQQKQRNSYKIIRVGLWYLVISSIGPWALGIIMNTAGSSSIWYRNAIYFYLHFQYNGWFIVTLLGLLIYLLEQKNINLSRKKFRVFYVLLNLGVIGSFSTSLLWMKPNMIVYVISILSVILQGIACYILLKKIVDFWKMLKGQLESKTVLMLKIAGILLVIKLLLQFIGSFPYYANLVSQNIDLVIGYLHWIFLGVVSISLFSFISHFRLAKISKTQIWMYFSGFIVTEGLIFYKGMSSWLGIKYIDQVPKQLFYASVFLCLTIFLILMFQVRKKGDRKNS
ncbi:MAG: hypothetical protein JKY22_05075 [Flavobacteriaceae bacterium]|nr:hypothetical protein [Flavobacteriaceae bacterium]